MHVILAYLCVYVLAWIYVSVYKNQSYWIGKELRTKYILRAKYVYRGWDIAELFRVSDCPFEVATVPGSIPASSYTVESEGQQMKQCWIKNIFKNPKNPPVCLNMCIDVSLYRPINIGLYLRICVCTYVLAWIYVSVYRNLSFYNRQNILFEKMDLNFLSEQAKHMWKIFVSETGSPYSRLGIESWPAKWL